jgi:lysyl-tRNA synthetase class 1
MYGSPQSLNLLLFKRFVGTKVGSVDSIPPHMDELDELEDVYFGRKKVVDEMERAKLKGLFEYCFMLRPPDEPGVHVPYNLMINLAKVAPMGAEAQFIREKLGAYGYLKQGESGLDERVKFSLNWVKDFGEAEAQIVEMTEKESRAVEGVIRLLKAAKDEEGYQGSVFDAARAEGMQPGTLFQLLYLMLIGQNQGPRFGPYVAAMGKKNVLKELGRSLKAS